MLAASAVALPLLSGVLLAPACGTTAPPLAGTTLHAYVFADSVPPGLWEDFQKTSGAKVDVQTYDTNEELLAKLKSSPNAYDLVMPSDYAVDVLIAADALHPLDLPKIPNYDNIAPSFLSPYFDPGGIAQAGRGHEKNEKFSLPWLWGTTGILYDPTVINPAPTKWADLWNPAYAGHVVLPDDPREALGIALLADGHSKNDTDPAHIDAAGQKLAALAKNAVALDANTPEHYFLAAFPPEQRATIAAVFNGNAVLARRDNPALIYVLPSDGAGIWFDNLAIPAGAPHPEAAEALINYLLSADAGAAVIDDLPFSTPNEAAAPALKAHDAERWKAYVNDPVSNPQMDALSGAVPVKNIGPVAQAHYEAVWAAIAAAHAPNPSPPPPAPPAPTPPTDAPVPTPDAPAVAPGPSPTGSPK